MPQALLLIIQQRRALLERNLTLNATKNPFLSLRGPAKAQHQRAREARELLNMVKFLVKST